MATPSTMLIRPVILRERSSICETASIILRHPLGLMKGRMPSITITSAIAINRLFHISTKIRQQRIFT